MWEIGDGEPENFETYETILLGFAADSGQIPDSVQDFLNTYDFGAKSIIPFVINGEDSMEELTSAISQIQPGALIRNNGLGISEENIEEHAQEITEWAKSLGWIRKRQIQKAVPEKTVRSRRQLMDRWMRGHARPSICGRKEICLQKQSIQKTMAVMQMTPTSVPR